MLVFDTFFPIQALSVQGLEKTYCNSDCTAGGQKIFVINIAFPGMLLSLYAIILYIPHFQLRLSFSFLPKL